MRPSGGKRPLPPPPDATPCGGGKNGGGKPMNGEKGAGRNGSGFGIFSIPGEPGKGNGDELLFSSGAKMPPFVGNASSDTSPTLVRPPPLAMVVSLRRSAAASACASSQRRSD